jgi:hypothetical protein
MPDSGYDVNAKCDWTIHCEGIDVPSISLTALDTETDFDFLELFDGVGTQTPLSGPLSGAMVDLDTTDYTGTRSDVMVEFTSDEDLGAGGFSLEYKCGSSGGH